MIHAPGSARALERDRDHLRVVVPYIQGMLRHETRFAVSAQWPDAWFNELAATDETAYTRLLLSEWDEDHTTIVVEQDIVPPPGSIEQLYRCAMPWCTVPYLINGRVETKALGLAKFSKVLKQVQAKTLHRVARYHGGRGAPVTWHNLDQVIASALTAAGVPVHPHADVQAVHLHDYHEKDNSER